MLGLIESASCREDAAAYTREDAAAFTLPTLVCSSNVGETSTVLCIYQDSVQKWTEGDLDAGLGGVLSWAC